MSTSPVRSTCAHPHQCSLDVRMQVMTRSPLTRDLTPQQHAELDEHLRALSWAEGDPLLLAGESPGGVYLMMSGRARVTRDTEEGDEITLDVAAPGDVIGPLATTVTEAVDSAWAMETTCALYLPAGSLAVVVEKFPTLALALLRLQQERLDTARERDVAHATRTVEQRVAGVLLHLADKLGRVRTDGSVVIDARLRRDDIAGMATTTVESASRAMAKMKREGLIDSGREWVVLLDAPALSAL